MRTMRLAARAAIVGLVLSCSAVGAPTAFADPETVAPVPAAAPAAFTPDSTIDVAKTGSLTIHKRLNPESFGSATGTAQDAQDAKGTPVEGVKFKISRVDSVNGEKIDLGTNEGYAKAQEFATRYSEAADRKAFLNDNQVALADTVEVVTGADGSATQSGLGVALYVVEEDVAGSTDIKVNGEAVNGALTQAAPFLVFLPMTNPSTNEWNYDIHAVPKNSTVGITKEVVDFKNDRGVNAGEVLEYIVTTDVPTIEAGQTLKEYVMSDKLPKEVYYTADKPMTVEIDGVALDAGDYTVEETPGNDVIVRFTEASGLPKLSQNGGKKVKFTIPVTVNAPDTAEADVDDDAAILGNDGNDVMDGVAVNRAVLSFTNQHGYTTQVESNSVKSRWGNLNILKTDPKKSGSDVALDGARFELYRCTDENTPKGDKLTVGGKSEWVSGEDGTKGLITIKGLQVTDLLNNEAQDNDAADKYCLKETQAPEGYELAPKMHVIDFKEEDLDAADPVTIHGISVENNRITQTAEVINLTKTSSFLPNTGGAGIGLLMAVGALIIGAGAWAAKRMSRKA